MKRSAVALRPFRVDADMLERSAVHRKPHRQILHNLLLRRLAVLIDVLIHTFLINLFNVIVVILFVHAKTSSLLPLHHIDRLDADASAAHDFDLAEFLFHQLHNCIVFRRRLDKLEQQAVFSVVDDLRLERLSDLEQLDFVSCAAVEYLDIQNLFHAHKHVGEVDDFDDLDHAVQLFFDLLKRLIVTDRGDRHTRYGRVLGRSDGQAVQVIAFCGKKPGNLGKDTNLVFYVQ